MNTLEFVALEFVSWNKFLEKYLKTLKCIRQFNKYTSSETGWKANERIHLVTNNPSYSKGNKNLYEYEFVSNKVNITVLICNSKIAESIKNGYWTYNVLYGIPFTRHTYVLKEKPLNSNG